MLSSFVEFPTVVFVFFGGGKNASEAASRTMLREKECWEHFREVMHCGSFCLLVVGMEREGLGLDLWDMLIFQ